VILTISDNFNGTEWGIFPTYSKGTQITEVKEDKEKESLHWVPTKIGEEEFWTPDTYIQEGRLTVEYNPTSLDVIEGERVILLDVCFEWFYVRKQDGVRGWIPSKIATNPREHNPHFESSYPVLEVIKQRTSYRGKYEAIPVPREDLIKIAEAGLAAPSGCNKQTTSLMIVDDPEKLNQLNTIIGKENIKTAPSMICVLTERIVAYKDGYGMDRCYHIHDYSAAIQNMLLAIVDLGYQSCWYEGEITDADEKGKKMAEILHVPDGMELVCFLPVGIASQGIRYPNKKAHETRMWINQF